MTIFATEFPVTDRATKASFTALVIAWIRGIRKSTLLSQAHELETYDDQATILGEHGEILTFKEYEGNGAFVVGARYDSPDNDGRLWRTEAVLTKKDERSFLRIRGQCIATTTGARVFLPKKPHLIRAAIDDAWGGNDGRLKIHGMPVFIDTPEATEIAANIILGRETRHLPVVYISATGPGTHAVDVELISKELSGVSHVLVEPGRLISNELRRLTDGVNPYGGAISVFLPKGGPVRRFFLGAKYTNADTLLRGVVDFVVSVQSAASAQFGWEWQDLQEAQAQRLRTQASSDSWEEVEQLFRGEIISKDETIRNLKEQVDALQAVIGQTVEPDDLLPASLVKKIGREIYPGEFYDRIRCALTILQDETNLDARSREVCKRFIQETSYTKRAVALRSKIKSAARSSIDELKRFLVDLGFGIRAGKHTKVEPSEDLFGVEMITLPNTPSDGQSGADNNVRDCVKALKIGHLN